MNYTARIDVRYRSLRGERDDLHRLSEKVDQFLSRIPKSLIDRLRFFIFDHRKQSIWSIGVTHRYECFADRSRLRIGIKRERRNLSGYKSWIDARDCQVLTN